MWIASKIGFFSVVEHRDLPGMVMVRARVEADLVALEALAKEIDMSPKKGFTMMASAGSDYQYRFIMPKETWARLLWQLSTNIDYDNFKNCIADNTRHDLYLRVWNVLHGLVSIDIRNKFKPTFSAEPPAYRLPDYYLDNEGEWESYTEKKGPQD